MDKYKHFISIICPTYNEEKFISNCLDSILQQDYPLYLIEIFIVDGRSNDKTRKIVAEYEEKHSFIRLLDNEDRIVPPALNLGIKESKGDVILRIDGHCIYPSNYISLLVEKLFELDADNVGAVWNTLPVNETTKSLAISIGVSHKFGIGDSLHKTGVKEVTQTDTVPYGCFKRSVFDKIGLFDNDLIRNQDDEFNGRIINNGGRIFLIPSLIIDYYARENWTKMSKMFYQYGLFKPLVNKKLGKPATIRQFFPMLFILGLVFGAILSSFSPIFSIVYSLVLVLYGALCLFFGIKESMKHKNIKLLILLPITFFIIHMSYGFGYLRGIVKLLLGKKIIVGSSR